MQGAQCRSQLPVVRARRPRNTDAYMYTALRGWPACTYTIRGARIVLDIDPPDQAVLLVTKQVSGLEANSRRGPTPIRRRQADRRAGWLAGLASGVYRNKRKVFRTGGWDKIGACGSQVRCKSMRPGYQSAPYRYTAR